MKKLFYTAIALLAFSACRENPDLSDLSNDYLVFTNYDREADFQGEKTYFMPDSVMVIGDRENPEYWTGETAAPILRAYESNMAAYGFTRVDDKSQALFGLQISYVESVSYFTNYHDPYWWYGYPGYWEYGYWGDWGGWYYPYSVVYSYSVGSLLTEMVDLRSPQGGGRKLPVVWTSFLSGLLTASSSFNMQLTVEAIDQSFAQSPYLDNQYRGN